MHAGKDGEAILDHLEHESPEVCYNAGTGQLDNMTSVVYIEPSKVTRSALQNAASVAALMLTTEAVVADKPDPNANNNAAAGANPAAGMGGMM